MHVSLPVAAFLLGTAAAGLTPDSLHAEAVPPQLRNKTISVAWQAERTVLTPGGERKSASSSGTRQIYVSSAGRFFVKGAQGSRSGAAGPDEQAPMGGARDVRLSGGKLVALAQIGGGAGRMVVSFDPGYSSCTVHVAYGLPAGQRVMVRTPNGVQAQLVGITFSGQTCAIRDGNAFAN